MKSKKILSIICLITCAAIIISIVYTKIPRNKKASYASNESFTETPVIFQNPYQGFYHLYGYMLSNDDTTNAIQLANTITQNDNYSLALLEINLKNFNNEDLSEQALAQLDAILSGCESANKKIILRILYDWDGMAQQTEPSDISVILSHMDSIAPIVNSYKNTVYIMQGIFVGNCGEMNNSVYMSDENMKTLINHLNDCTDKDIYLAVRTPAHYRIITDRTDAITEEEAFDGNLYSRISLFNDGMLGSDTDLGTYGTSSNKGSSNPADKGTRAEEIDFQKQLCNFVPNGGECVLDNSFNDFKNAISDFENMHVSYLNCDYDADVLNKWKNSVYEVGADNIFNNMPGYDYIMAHLGYRYTITGADFEYNRLKSSDAVFSIHIKNSGFSSAYKKFDGTLILKSTNESDEYLFTSAYDNRTLKSNTEDKITFNIDTSTVNEGTYKAYYIMKDTASSPEIPIRFTNDSYSDETGVYLGEITVEQ